LSGSVTLDGSLTLDGTLTLQADGSVISIGDCITFLEDSLLIVQASPDMAYENVELAAKNGISKMLTCCLES
jgi:hypothetical protein